MLYTESFQTWQVESVAWPTAMCSPPLPLPILPLWSAGLMGHVPEHFGITVLIGLSEFSGTLFTHAADDWAMPPIENLPSISAVGQPPAGCLYFFERAFIYHVTHTLKCTIQQFPVFSVVQPPPFIPDHSCPPILGSICGGGLRFLCQAGFGPELQDKPQLTGPLSFHLGAKLQHHNRPVPLRGGQHLQVV